MASLKRACAHSSEHDMQTFFLHLSNFLIFKGNLKNMTDSFKNCKEEDNTMAIFDNMSMLCF